MDLNFLTNPNRNLEQKMRYFADYFLFANDFLGKLPDLPFDNPISYVSKIIFQIENNIERSPRYIQNHFSQLFNFYGDFLTKNTQAFQAVKNEFARYDSSPAGETRKVNWIKANPIFLSALRNLHTELEETLFTKVFLTLNKFIVCKHKLSTHQKGIEFYTQLLVSLFRLNNHPKKSVREYIARILSSDRYNFPFPLEIYAHNKDESFISLTQAYLDNRDFMKQFEGLKNLMENPMHRKGYFVYAINHISFVDSFKNDFKLQLDNVTFISPYHPQLKEIRKSARQKDRENDKFTKIYPRFFGRFKMLAYVELHYEDKKITSHEGAKIVTDEINYLNGFLDISLKLQEENYIFTESFQENDWHARFSLMKFKLEWMDKFKYDRLIKNPFEIFRQTGISNQLLHNEKVFMRAAGNNEISLFWQYIENLFWFQNVKSDTYREKFAKILIREIDQFTDFLFMCIGHLFYGLQYSKNIEDIGLDKSTLELLSAQLGWQRNLKFPIGKYKSAIKHPFLKRMIGYYQQSKSQKVRPKWEAYLKSLILELQEFRNAELHSGYVNEFARIKMQEVIPSVMNTARWAIIREWEKDKSLSFTELMSGLTT